jgi:membrane-associated protease RseP (regulator of RpoE activity)
MKKHVKLLSITAICVSLFAGCASTKQIYQRGWIGGQYLEADPSALKKISADLYQKSGYIIHVLPEQIKKRQSGAVFVSRVYENTPLMRAGIREGDLIVEVNNQKVETLKKFRRIVDESKPGENITVSIYHDGSIMDMPIVIGKETFQKLYTFAIGIGSSLTTAFDPVPNPEFNLFLLSYQTRDERVDLNSPEYQYYQKTKSRNGDKDNKNPDFEAKAEGWGVQAVIFGFSGQIIVLEQAM